jgi:hypothetical protein
MEKPNSRLDVVVVVSNEPNKQSQPPIYFTFPRANPSPSDRATENSNETFSLADQGAPQSDSKRSFVVPDSGGEGLRVKQSGWA